MNKWPKNDEAYWLCYFPDKEVSTSTTESSTFQLRVLSVRAWKALMGLTGSGSPHTLLTAQEPISAPLGLSVLPKQCHCRAGL